MGCKPGKDDRGHLTDIVTDRHCTDPLYFLLFIVFWALTFWVLGDTAKQGASPDRVIYGSDLSGRICGKDDGVKDKPFVVNPWPPEYWSQVCVSSCDETNTNDNIMPHKYESYPFLSRCIPIKLETPTIEIKVTYGDYKNEISTQQIVADLYETRWAILSSAFTAFVMSLLYISIIRKCAHTLVVVGICLMLLTGFVVGALLITSANNADASLDFDKNKVLLMRIFGWGFIIITAMAALTLCVMRKSLQLAIKVSKIAAKALIDMPSLLCYPVIPVTAAVGYAIVWYAIAIQIYSVGSLQEQPTPKCVYSTCYGILNTTNQNPRTMQAWVPDKQYHNWFWFHVFGGFWNMQFIVYFAFMVIAGAVADWYFTRVGDDGKKVRGHEEGQLAPMPLIASMCRATRYHIGSIACGSLIIAIIKFVRTVIQYLQKKAFGENPNPLMAVLACLVKCCLRCVECCIDKINKNAFIYIAVWGCSFCEAGCKSFALLWKNLGAVAAINTVSNTLIWLGKFGVTFMTAGIYAIALNSLVGTKISSILYPGLIIVFLSNFVARLTMLIVETVIDTTFLCYLVDLECNGMGGQMLASEELNALVEENKEESYEMHEKKKLMTAQYHGEDYDPSAY